MIIASLSDAERYYPLHPLLRPLFEYVRSHFDELRQVPAGRITLQGDDLFINVCDTEIVNYETRPYEAHRKYMDVHIPLSETEMREWVPARYMPIPTQLYDDTKDCETWDWPEGEKDSCFVIIGVGDFCIDYPEDVHKPCIDNSSQGDTIRKLVAKVRIDAK